MWQVIGQDKAVELLRHSLKDNNLSHAYLFLGPPQVGKGTLAMNLAEALNCSSENPPCQQCSSCFRISKGIHTDIWVLDLESSGSARRKAKTEIGIDEIREIQHVASLPPFEGKSRVFIIDGAENLSNEAANCLLKVLEEPSRGVVFVLLASDESRVLPTVASRCQRVELRPMPTAALKSVLVSNYGLSDDDADILARVSQGRLGTAVRALKDDGWLKEREQNIQELTDLLMGDWEERVQYAVQLAGLYEKERSAGEKVIDAWLTWWRDLMLVKNGCDDKVVNMNHESVLREMSCQLSLEQITGFIRAVGNMRHQVYQNVNTRLAVEALLMEMPRIRDVELEECRK